MNDPFKGESPLARLADPLPVRTRIGIAVVAADLALTHFRDSPDLSVAHTVFELARRWFDGARFDAHQFADGLDPEYDRGTGMCSLEAKTQDETSAWLALDSAVAYVAFHANRELGRLPAAELSEVDETVLDELDKTMRAISPEFMKTMKTAADYLQREKRVSFAQLNGVIAQQ